MVGKRVLVIDDDVNTVELLKSGWAPRDNGL